MVRRIEKLAVLPIFYKLEGQKVVVAGGSDAAAWKAELLAACGARVHVYAEKLSNVFIEKITSIDSCGSYVHQHKNWDATSFEDAALAIGDAENDEQANEFYKASRKAGVPVNVIDNPDYCEFQFGSIVNRSPVIVSISTNGAAPILGQTIRQKIETILPKSLGDWALIGASLRTHVAGMLASGAPRRQFWQIFSRHAFGDAPDQNARHILTKTIDNISSGVSGPKHNESKITLVETFSDDVEMLTIKEVRALQSADVILYDKSVSNEILEIGRREARHVQAAGDVSKKLVALAGKGQHVVRITNQNSNFTLDDLDKSLHSTRYNIRIERILRTDRYGSRDF